MKANGLWLEQTDRDEQILEAAERILRRKLKRQGKITDPTISAAFLRAHCAYRDREIFGCVFLDTKHAILAVEDLFFGTVDSAEVHPPRDRQAGAPAERRRRHRLPQPPLRQPRAFRSRPRHHPDVPPLSVAGLFGVRG